MDQAELWLELLQQDGCRITAPRRVIVELLANSPRALDAIELFDLSRKVQPGIGLVTVYRTLEKLEKLNLIQRVHREDGCHMVMKAAVGHQHYLVCTSCGRTTLFQGDDISPLITTVESETGYRVEDHWLQLLGTCPSCLKDTETLPYPDKQQRS